MNHVLSLVRAARNSAGPDAQLQTARLLAELLTLHEETLAQLLLERLRAIDRVDYLTGMIEHHQDAARVLQAKLGAGMENGEQAPARPPQFPAAS